MWTNFPSLSIRLPDLLKPRQTWQPMEHVVDIHRNEQQQKQNRMASRQVGELLKCTAENETLVSDVSQKCSTCVISDDSS